MVDPTPRKRFDIKINWPSIVNSVVILVVIVVGVSYLSHRQTVGNHRQEQNNARFEATATCVAKVLTLTLNPPIPPPARAVIRQEISADCAALLKQRSISSLH